MTCRVVLECQYCYVGNTVCKLSDHLFCLDTSDTCSDQERSFVIHTPKYLKEDTLSSEFPMTVSGVGGRMAWHFLVIIMYFAFTWIKIQ